MAASPYPAPAATPDALLRRRTAAWACLGAVHAESSERWCGTVQVTRQQIERHLAATLGTVKVAQRTRHFLVLGMSLGPVLAAHNAAEMARAAVKVLDDWETWVEGGMMANAKGPGVGTGVKNLFRAQRSGRKSTSSATESSHDHHGLTPAPHATSSSPTLLRPDSTLVIVHLPFALDYFQTIISLCELIRSLYTRLGELVLAPRSPRMIASSEIPGYTAAVPAAVPVSQSAGSFSPATGGATSPPPEYSLRNYTVPTSPWSAGLTDLITKLDQRLKKPLITLTREVEHVARTTINDQLAAMLRDLTAPSSSSSSSSLLNPSSSGPTTTTTTTTTMIGGLDQPVGSGLGDALSEPKAITE